MSEIIFAGVIFFGVVVLVGLKFGEIDKRFEQLERGEKVSEKAQTCILCYRTTKGLKAKSFRIGQIPTYGVLISKGMICNDCLANKLQDVSKLLEEEKEEG